MASRNLATPLRAVVLAGGAGTRLAPYTTVLPKPLMPIGDLPILEIVVRQLRHAGFTNLNLAVGYLSSLIEAYFGDGARWDIDIEYCRETHPLGTAGPLRLVRTLTDTFLVMNGDILTTLDYADLVRFHRDSHAVATVGVFQKDVTIDLGVIEVDQTGHVANYIEKPTMHYLVSMGVYALEPCALDYIPPGERFDLPDLMKKLIKDRQRTVAYPFDGQWLDIGCAPDYALAVELFSRQRATFLAETGA